MKLNWGNSIALVYGLFALTMITVVMVSRQYDPGLVSKDYYNLDLNYQEHFNKKQNAANLATGLKVGYDAVRQVIRLQFPAQTGAPAGSVKCFRSATVQDDLLLEIKANADGQMEIPAEKLVNGLWHLEVDWQAEGTKYFNEATVTIIHA